MTIFFFWNCSTVIFSPQALSAGELALRFKHNVLHCKILAAGAAGLLCLSHCFFLNGDFYPHLNTKLHCQGPWSEAELSGQHGKPRKWIKQQPLHGTHSATKLCHHLALFALCDADSIQCEEALLHRKRLTCTLLTAGHRDRLIQNSREVKEKKPTPPLSLLMLP